MAETKKLTTEEILEAIGNMSVLELSEMVKEMEEKFGVTAQAPVMQAVAGGAVPGAGADAAAAEEEKTEFDVELVEVGDQRIKVIRAVREVTSVGLKEAKDLVEGVPSNIKEGVDKEEAEKVKAKLEEAGAKVNIK